MKICVDAGHGGKDSGAVGIGRRLEKTDTLKFALALAAKCRAAGMSVVQTRTGDSYPALTERAILANASRCDYFISIHRNAYIFASANGLECLVAKNGSETSKLLAADIQRRMLAIGGRDRCGGIGYKLQNATVLTETFMPATTIELGFVTNAADNLLFDSRFDLYVQAVYDGIVDVSGFKPAKNEFTYKAKKDTVFITSASTIKAGSAVELLAYPLKSDSINSDTVARARMDGKDGLIVFGDFEK